MNDRGCWGRCCVSECCGYDAAAVVVVVVVVWPLRERRTVRNSLSPNRTRQPGDFERSLPCSFCLEESEATDDRFWGLRGINEIL